MTESITPRSQQTPEIRFQPSVLSLRSTASTVAPEDQAPPSAHAASGRAPRRRLWFFAALGALSMAAGVASLAGSRGHVSSDVRSGSPGYKSTPSGKQIHWAKSAVTVYLDPSLQKLGSNADEAVMQAFGQWVGSDPRLPNLSFDTGGTSAEPKQDGKSTVSYSNIKVPGHERDLAITITYSNDQTGEILEADIVLNASYPMAALVAKTKDKGDNGHAKGDDHHDGKGDDRHDGKGESAQSGKGDDHHDGKGESAQSGKGSGNANSGNANASKKSTSTDESEDCQDRYDTQNVATHEAGHFFGLGEDMVERESTMFLSIDQCETHKRVLSATDTQAITTLYAQNANADEAQAGPRGCSFGVSRSPEPLAVAGLIFGLSLLRRRRPR